MPSNDPDRDCEYTYSDKRLRTGCLVDKGSLNAVGSQLLGHTEIGQQDHLYFSLSVS